MRIHTRVIRLEKSLKPKSRITFTAHSESEVEQILREHPEARFATILLVEKIKKPANSGL